MDKTEQIIEFDKIKEAWGALALTQRAREQIAAMRPMLSESELRTKMRETTQARILIEKCGNPPLAAFTGIEAYFAAAQKGSCLAAAQLEEIGTALVAIRRMKSWLEDGKRYELSLPYYGENLNALPGLEEEIRMQIRGGSVDDNATPLLRELRGKIVRAEEKMRERAEAVMRANKECMSDTYSTMRNGHICVPVKKEYKFKISGSMIDKSATGNTLFIEPASVTKYYEELCELRIDAENEERRILYTLSAMAADGSEAFRESLRLMEKLDFIFSKGKLSIDYGCVEPAINTDRRIILKGARHPLMDRKTCVPLQFSLGDGVKGIVITGPNTGGKTVAIKTVAISCMMAQCGLHVAADEADICMNSNYLCDIGDGQNLSENLSTFSAHITNVLDILQNVNRDSLVILDELGSGTDPTEGMGIAVAILEELSGSGALYLVTTHYPEIKQYAQCREGIVNARMTFDRESLRPLYQLVIGEAGESCAFHIARRLGMPDSMLRTAAEAAYGTPAYAPGAEQEPGRAPETAFASGRTPRIEKIKEAKGGSERARSFRRGDSVMVYPDRKIGIVCETANEKGVLRIQMPNKKIWVNHKRIKLHVAAAELYPEDYDFSIIFDTVENRKLRHQMERRYVEGEIHQS